MPEQPPDPLHYEMKIPPEPKHKHAEDSPSDENASHSGTENADRDKKSPTDRRSPQTKP